ncbi:MAG: hypothetical protein KJN68_04300, partial [Bacteroidia bacterium]|nr:hypothetical protein [Bacteroidia bacterium]
NGPMELGFYRWTGQLNGYKEFILNAVNYLLDDNGLINIRSKDLSLAFLDQQKIAQNGTFYKLLNIILPLIVLALFGWLFQIFRRKKYTL